MASHNNSVDRGEGAINKSNVSAYLLSLCVVLNGSLVNAEDGHTGEDEHHSHHVALGGGNDWHGHHSSAYLGIDYIDRFTNNYAVGALYAQVSGAFDLRAYGTPFGGYITSAWKVRA